MRYAGTLLSGWLGGANIHSSIHLHGIDRDELAAHSFCEMKRHLGFPNCGRAGEQYSLGQKFGSFGAAHWMKTTYLATRGVCLERIQSKISPAARMPILTSCAGVAQPPR